MPWFIEYADLPMKQPHVLQPTYLEDLIGRQLLFQLLNAAHCAADSCVGNVHIFTWVQPRQTMLVPLLQLLSFTSIGHQP